MFYLFTDTKEVCRWCREILLQIIDGDPSKVVVKLCPVCDRWPPELLSRKNM